MSLVPCHPVPYTASRSQCQHICQLNRRPRRSSKPSLLLRVQEAYGQCRINQRTAYACLPCSAGPLRMQRIKIHPNICRDKKGSREILPTSCAPCLVLSKTNDPQDSEMARRHLAKGAVYSSLLAPRCCGCWCHSTRFQGPGHGALRKHKEKHFGKQ